MKRNRLKPGQIAITLIYPLAFFVFLSLDRQPESWTIPIAALILFSLLWENLIYLFISNLLTWVVAVPLWLYLLKPYENQSLTSFSASLPFIILLFVGVVLIPEMLIVAAKNYFVKKFTRRRVPK